MSQTRNARWDNIKLVLIVFVVLGHICMEFSSSDPSLRALRLWIYLFHVPAFMYISGLFSKRAIREKRWSRAVSFLMLFIFMTVVRFIVDASIHGIKKASMEFVNVKGVPWFALALFWFFLVSMLIDKVHPAYILAVSFALGLIVGYTKLLNTFALQKTIVYFPFFYLGYLSDVEKIDAFLNKIAVKIAGAVVIIASAILVFINIKTLHKYMNFIRVRGTYRGAFHNYELGFLWRILSYLLSALLIVAVFSLVPKIKIPFITWAGRKTLSVYAFHFPVFLLLNGLIKPFANWMTQDYIVLKCVVLSLVITAITCLPPFDFIVRKVITIPPKKDQSKA